MKKIIAIVLAMMTVFSYATIAFAENATTFTTTVPGVEYTLNIPESQEIPFGTDRKELTVPTVTNATGFAEGKDLKVTVDYPKDDEWYGSFTSEDVSTKIRFGMGWSNENGGDELDYLYYKGQTDGTTEEKPFYVLPSGTVEYVESILIYFCTQDWYTALPGDYSATITFTAEVVSTEAETKQIEDIT